MFWIRSLTFLGLVAAVYILFGTVAETASLAFALLTGLLLLFVANEVRIGLRHEGLRLTSYVLLTSLWMFGFNHGIPNAVYFQSSELLFALQIQNPGFHYLAHFQALACLAAFGLWAGYRSGFAIRLGHTIESSPRVQGLLRWDFESTRWGIVWTLLAIAYIARTISFSLGIYGYGGDISRMIALASIRQYLTYAGQVGLLVLVVVAIAHFRSTNSERRWKHVLWFVLAGETVWGLLAGFKSMMVMPAIVTTVVATLVQGRVPRKMPVLAVGLLLAAYALIEPFREIRMNDASLDTQNVGAVAGTMVDIARGDVESESSTASVGTAYQFMARTVMTEMGARAVQYKNEVGLKADDPPFLQNLIFGPVYGLIPRVLWPSKPMANTGAWFTKVLYGEQFTMTATDMTAIAYMYFGGGILMVLIGFYVIGVAQRTAEVALSRVGPGNALLYVGLMSALVVTTSEVWGVLGVTLQLVIMLTVVQGRMFAR